MQMKNYMAVMISLAVSVILVVGVLVPVIADNSGSGNGGSAHTNVSNTDEYYIRADENTNLSLYKTVKDFGDEQGYSAWYSYEDLDENPDAERWTNNSTLGIILMGEYYFADGNSVYDFAEGSETEIVWPIVINGTTATVTTTGDASTTFENVCFITSSQSLGNYTAITNNGSLPAEIPFVSNSWVGIVIDEWLNSINAEALILGFGQCDTGTFKFSNLWDWTTPSELSNGTFNIDDGYLTSVTIPYDDVDKTYSVTDADVDATVSYYVPIQIGDDSGSSSMSPTISAMLSVIPLIVIVGLIIGAVTYFIRRQ